MRGGFPGSLLTPGDVQSLDWRRDFIRSQLERDVPMFAPRLPAETIGRLWTMVAYQQGSVLNQSCIASALACDDLQIEQRYVVYPGTERIALCHGAQAIGLQELAGLLLL
ncbi:MAG: ATPase [Polaromonas sp.]|nr:ATPase [Polaromonas sp.]